MAAIVVWLACPLAACALEKTNDGRPDRVRFMGEVRQLFFNEDFPALEALATKLRDGRERFPEGLWKLPRFYAALNPASVDRATVDWVAWLDRFVRWSRAFPDSTTAVIAHAEALTGYAWQARGGGYANTVTEEGWRLFGERLNGARSLLERFPQARACPEYYSVMLTVALGQGWDRAEYDRLFVEAVTLASDYEEFYFKKAYYLQPKWHGRPGEWHEFALDAAAATAVDQGMALYTRIVWTQFGPGSSKRFREAGIDWPKMRQGFEDIARRYPDSLWNKNAYCYFAAAAGDRITTRRLMVGLRDRYAPELWSSEEYYLKVKQWAFAGAEVE